MLRACPSTINVPAAARLEPLIVYYSLHVSKFCNPQVENARILPGEAERARQKSEQRGKKGFSPVYLHYALGAPATPQKTPRQPRAPSFLANYAH
jgi:hypothetical protein